MKPQSFALLAITAALSLLAALFVYSSSAPWSRQAEAGAALFPGLAAKAGDVAEIQVSNAGRSVTVARDGDRWILKTRDGFEVMPETVRSLLKNAGDARLADAKTKLPERYPALQLEDPSAKNARSTVLMLLDGKGTVLAEAILGKVRPDAFGAGKDGTYVRKAGDPQTWLVDTALAPGISLRDWSDTRLVDNDAQKLKRIVIEVSGEEPLELVSDGKRPRGFKLGKMPDEMKLKFTNVLDNITEAASGIQFDDVRKLPQGATYPDGYTLETDDGFKSVIRMRKDGTDTWATASISGEGSGKAQADEAMKRFTGYEFRITSGKGEQILKKRSDILEKPGNETTDGKGASFFEEQNKGAAPPGLGPMPGGLGTVPGGPTPGPGPGPPGPGPRAAPPAKP